MHMHKPTVSFTYQLYITLFVAKIALEMRFCTSNTLDNGTSVARGSPIMTHYQPPPPPENIIMNPNRN